MSDRDFMNGWKDKESSNNNQDSSFFSPPLFQQSSPNVSITTNDNNLQEVTDENFDGVLEYVNERIKIFEISSTALNFSGINSTEKNSILSVLFKVFRLREKELNESEELSNEISKLQCDNDSLSKKLEMKEKKIKDIQVSKDQEKYKFRKIIGDKEKVIKEKEKEVKKLKFELRNLEQKKVQYEHKQSRSEQIIRKHKEKLNKFLQQSKNYSKPKMTIKNDVSFQKGITFYTKGNKRNENNMYQLVTSAFEDEKKILIQDNQELNETIKGLSEQFSRLRNIVYSKKGIKEYTTNVTEISKGQFNLPYQYSRENIEETLKNKIDEIDQILSDFDNEKTESSREDLVEKFQSLNKIFADNIDNEEQWQIATNILNVFNEKVYYFHHLLSQQNRLLELDYLETKKGGIIKRMHQGEMELMNQRKKDIEQQQAELERKSFIASQAELDKRQVDNDNDEITIEDPSRKLEL